MEALKYTPPGEIIAAARAAQTALEVAGRAVADAAVRDVLCLVAKAEALSVADVAVMHDTLEQIASDRVHESDGKDLWAGFAGRAGLAWARKVHRKAAGAPSDAVLSGRISKVNDDQRLVFGWASVAEEAGDSVVDAHNEIIGESDLEDMAYRFMLECQDGGTMHERLADRDAPRVVSKVVESIVFTKAKQEALGIDLGRVAWWVGFKVADDETWGRVKKGELSAFSIHGRARRETVKLED